MQTESSKVQSTCGSCTHDGNILLLSFVVISVFGLSNKTTIEIYSKHKLYKFRKKCSY